MIAIESEIWWGRVEAWKGAYAVCSTRIIGMKAKAKSKMAWKLARCSVVV